MESVWPEPRKQLPPRKTRLDAFKPAIDQMLQADLDAPRKQRHTVKRIFDRLLDEHGAVEVTYPMVRAYVAVRRPQIRIEAGRGPLNAFIPQTHMPGAEAEVDFGDVTIRLASSPATNRCGPSTSRRTLDPAVIHTLATCQWVKKGLPLCLIGDSGTGKSHLLIALGTEAAMAGYRVRYTLATKLVNELVEAADEKVLTKTIARYGRVDLLCIG